ncbi:MAG: type II toxin-antitoxin system VapC family toxin [Ignavibacteria bacterium]|nr:type II toxin-antitoxin system VapC family toxin [Ignavibacteria bacterium]
MNLVDSSGWLEYFTDGKNSKLFAPAIEDNDNLIVSSINLYEVYKKVMTQRSENDAKDAAGLMMQAKIIEVNASIAVKAARLSCKMNIPMADSIIYITAQVSNAIVWTQDYDFKDLEGVKFFKKESGKNKK